MGSRKRKGEAPRRFVPLTAQESQLQRWEEANAVDVATPGKKRKQSHGQGKERRSRVNVLPALEEAGDAGCSTSDAVVCSPLLVAVGRSRVRLTRVIDAQGDAGSMPLKEIWLGTRAVLMPSSASKAYRRIYGDLRERSIVELYSTMDNSTVVAVGTLEFEDAGDAYGGRATASIIRLCTEKRVFVRVSKDSYAPRSSPPSEGDVLVGLEFLIGDSVLDDSPIDAADRVMRRHHRDMQVLMGLLRPWLSGTTPQAARVSFDGDNGDDSDDDSDVEAGLDPSALFAAVLPTGKEPMLEKAPDELVPALRKYQARAAEWMLSRERGMVASSSSSSSSSSVPSKTTAPAVSVSCDQKCHPLWTELAVEVPSQTAPSERSGTGTEMASTTMTLYYNLFTGRFSREAFDNDTIAIKGGILADEMGLGKTVEVLACVLSNRLKPKADGLSRPDTDESMNGDLGAGSPPPLSTTVAADSTDDSHIPERIDCVCGATTDDVSENVLWVLCEFCKTWMHARCVGYRPPRAHRSRGACIPETDEASKEAEDPFICGRCARERASVVVEGVSKSTLIVCPSAILPQWVSEIQRHVDTSTFSMRVYNGQSQQAAIGGLSSSITTSRDLASCDVVLTTYEALRSDIHHEAELTQGHGSDGKRSLRFEKRYKVIPTPLTRLCWWRICLDEAQMVESGTAAAASMALKLNTIHRWCVTGTPISRGLEDIQGLLRFLRCHPWSDSVWWRKAVQLPYEKGSEVDSLHSMLRCIMWRNTKVAVATELGLPGQAEIMTRLTMNAIERHFYKKQHELCSKVAKGMMGCLGSDTDTKDRMLTEREASRILDKLILLRQACSHPQVGRGGIRLISSSSSAPLSMEEILKTLVERGRLEAEESQRQVVHCLNGLAGVQQLEKCHAEAVASYREVLAMSEENLREGVRLDPLLKLHATHNLHQLLSVDEAEKRTWSSIPAKTLRDGQLRTEAEKIEKTFLQDDANRLLVQTAKYKESHDTTEKGLKDCKGIIGDGWWAQILQQWGREGDAGLAFIDRVKDGLADIQGRFDSKNAASIADRFRDVHGLRMVLSSELETMSTARQDLMKVIERLKKVSDSPSDYEVWKAGHCSRCRTSEMQSSGVTCVHCETNSDFVKYEARLFSIRFRAISRGQATDVQHVIEKFSSRDRRIPNSHVGGAEDADDGDVFATESRSRRLGTASDTIHVSELASESERVLKMIASKLDADTEVGARARRHVETMESLRAEFLSARAMAVAQRESLARRDELSMATMTMVLADPDQAIPEHEKIYRLYPDEVPALNVKLSQEKLMYADDLRKALGQLRYLRGLSRRFVNESQDASKEADASSLSKDAGARAPAASVAAAEDSNCPICQEQLDTEFFILPCGHMLCPECCTGLQERAAAGVNGTLPTRLRRIRCPTCRVIVPGTDIAHVNSGDDAGKSCRSLESASLGTIIHSGSLPWEGGLSALDDETALPVRGSYSTKIEAIVRRLLWLRKTDATSKTLVFSQWPDALEILGHALAANAVRFSYAANRRALGKALDTFRGKKVIESADKAAEKVGTDDNTNVLLMPFALGANGLNITEAQHVVLMEPLLDPGMEVQAMGRVHRIGQQRVTVVHRFVISESVEENVATVFARRIEAMGKRLVKKQQRNAMRISELKTLLEEL